jgi:hypothetical protein
MGTHQGALIMPKLSVFMLRTSLLCMAIGFLFGAMVLHHKGVPIYLWTWSLLPPHIELMIFGWTVQFAMGMGFWILPRYSPGEIVRHRRADRWGGTRRVWLVYALYNLGLFASAWGGFAAAGGWQVVGRGAILVAVGLYIGVMWPRVRAFAVIQAQSGS